MAKAKKNRVRQSQATVAKRRERERVVGLRRYDAIVQRAERFHDCLGRFLGEHPPRCRCGFCLSLEEDGLDFPDHWQQISALCVLLTWAADMLDCVRPRS